MNARDNRQTLKLSIILSTRNAEMQCINIFIWFSVAAQGAIRWTHMSLQNQSGFWFTVIYNFKTSESASYHFQKKKYDSPYARYAHMLAST